jgi:4-diphosphocytidyl-2-C-methyl-D-erythritol kinase
MKEEAQAKINLSLRVLRRREDGFHEIETTIAPIALQDSVSIAAANQFEFRCNDPTLSTGEDNLVVRAARLFFAETKIPSRVSITLEKNIPHGAGLGGGSSDAAATLRGLNKFFEAKLGPPELGSMADRLGSDVPFFLQGGVAICRGRGESIAPVALPSRLELLLLKPKFAVMTAWAYSRWRDARELPDVKYSTQTFQGHVFINDLERPVFEKFPFVATLKNWLLRQPEVAVALMSGSGSTVFAIMKSTAGSEILGRRASAELDADLWILPVQTSESNFGRL